MTSTPFRPLAGLRVLDIARPSGSYAGLALARLGASVTYIDDGGRLESDAWLPLLGPEAELEGALAAAYMHEGKRRRTYDPESASDRAALGSMIGETDVLIEGMNAQERARLVIDGRSPLEINPNLVHTSITPFGKTGPHADLPATDLTLMALGGLLSLGGYPDGAPQAPWGMQAYMAGEQFAVVGTLIALHARDDSNRGQHVDVSIQESVCMALENAVQYVDLEDTVRRRYGTEQRQAGVGIFACEDGYLFLMAGGFAAERFWPQLVAWLRDEGFVAEADELAADVWYLREHQEADAAKGRFRTIFESFCRGRGKQDLYHQAQARGIPAAPVNTPHDLIDGSQMRARGFMRHLDVEVGRRTLQVAAPGNPFRFNGVQAVAP